MKHAAPQIQAQIREAIANGGTQDVSTIMASIEQTGSLNYTRTKAVNLAECAKNRLLGLGDTPYKEALAVLCDVAVKRNS